MLNFSRVIFSVSSKGEVKDSRTGIVVASRLVVASVVVSKDELYSSFSPGSVVVVILTTTHIVIVVGKHVVSVTTSHVSFVCVSVSSVTL